MKYTTDTRCGERRVLYTFQNKAGEFVDKIEEYKNEVLDETFHYSHNTGGSFNSDLKPMMAVDKNQLLEMGWIKLR